MKAITMVALCGVTIAGGVAAQASPVRPAAGGCFRGAPADRCSWFLLTESGVHYRLTDLIPGDERVLFSGSLGLMVNTPGGAAWGGEAFAGLEGDLRGGLALRWRRWLGGRSSLDVAAGVHLLGNASGGAVRAGSPMVQARYTLGDLLGASARLDVLAIRNGCPEAICFSRGSWTSERLYVGGELGSSLGLGAMVLAGLAVSAFALSYGN